MRLAHIPGVGFGQREPCAAGRYDAVVDTSTWAVPNEFQVLQRAGDVSRDEMFRTFNMGVGMVVVTDARSADAVISNAHAAGVHAWKAGRIVRGSGNVVLE